LRTASAFAISGVFLTGNCADPFHPKTIRATMGAVFRMPVWETDYEALRRLLTRAGLPLYGAALQTGAKSPQTLSGGFPAAVAIGSEGKGLSPALLSLCDQTVRIPMEPGCESLNAASAAAVLFWERYKGGEGGK
ncbi:MAG: RNA methyltransferase, partial [Oscillospiraceae bacterium]|nr:RNA methyltransferase [Oscillospiraceae bacterium]